MKDNKPVPCKDCIAYAMCVNSQIRGKGHVGPFLTALSKKCSIISEYLYLVDLNIQIPPDHMPLANRRYFTVPQAKRLVKLCAYMNWTDKFDLSFYYDLAYGGGT